MEQIGKSLKIRMVSSAVNLLLPGVLRPLHGLQALPQALGRESFSVGIAAELLAADQVIHHWALGG